MDTTYTPTAVVEQHLNFLQMVAGPSWAPREILTPTAGAGAWTRACRRRWPTASITAIEVNEREAAALEAVADVTVITDAMAWARHQVEVGAMGFDLIADNPPWSNYGEWVEALHPLLNEGGFLQLYGATQWGQAKRTSGVVRRLRPIAVGLTGGRVSHHVTGGTDALETCSRIWSRPASSLSWWSTYQLDYLERSERRLGWRDLELDWERLAEVLDRQASELVAVRAERHRLAAEFAAAKRDRDAARADCVRLTAALAASRDRCAERPELLAKHLPGLRDLRQRLGAATERRDAANREASAASDAVFASYAEATSACATEDRERLTLQLFAAQAHLAEVMERLAQAEDARDRLLRESSAAWAYLRDAEAATACATEDRERLTSQLAEAQDGLAQAENARDRLLGDLQRVIADEDSVP